MNKEKVVSKKTVPHVEPITKSKLAERRDKDRENVKGVFQYFELPGGTLSFLHRLYKEDSIKKYTLEDGKIYTIPLGVARHLNANCKYPVHRHQVEENGQSSQLIGKKVSRTGFRSLDFMSIEDLAECEPEIIVSDSIVN